MTVRFAVTSLMLAYSYARTTSRAPSSRRTGSSTYRPPRGGTFYRTQSYNNNNLTPLLLASILISTSNNNNRREFPSNCDNSTLTLTLSNGTSYYNVTEILPIIQLDPEGKNITANSVIELQCYKLTRNMASILGLSLGLGIPIVVFLLVCVCCSTYNFRKERQKIQKRDHEIKIEKQRYKEAQVRWDESAKAKLIQKAEKVETVKTVPNLYDPQYAPRLNQLPRNWEQFMNTGSYVMRVAQILDTKTIPYEVWDWLMFKDQEFYEYLKKQDNPVSNILKHLLECEAKHHNKSLHEVYMNTYIPMCTKLDRSYPLPIDTHMPAVL